MTTSTSTTGGVVVKSKMKILRASTMPEPPSPKWLAVGWLPRSAVTVLAGDEGIGKSLWWVLVTAHVTTGQALPEIGLPARVPADVIIVVTEDSWAEVKARLVLAGADLDRVHLVCEEEDGSGAPVFPPDMQVVTDQAAVIRPGLIVLDAWLDTVHSGLQVRDTQQAREALHPWREVATKFECSVLLIVNTNRMNEASTRDRIGATGALRQKARMLLFAAAEAGAEGSQLFVGPDKANGTARHNAVRFDIQVEQVRYVTVDDPGTVAILGRPVEEEQRIGALIDQWRADEKKAAKAAKAPTADQLAETWLRSYIAEHGDPVPVVATQEAAAVAGHTARRITSVLKAMGGRSRALVAGGPWFFTLKADPVLSGTPVSQTHSKTGRTGKTDDNGQSVLSVLPDLPPVRETGGTDKTDTTSSGATRGGV